MMKRRSLFAALAAACVAPAVAKAAPEMHPSMREPVQVHRSEPSPVWAVFTGGISDPGHSHALFEPSAHTHSVMDPGHSHALFPAMGALVGELRVFSSREAVPQYWKVCDGTDGTLDLRGFQRPIF